MSMVVLRNLVMVVAGLLLVSACDFSPNGYNNELSNITTKKLNTSNPINLANYAKSDARILKAYKNRQSDIQIKGAGKVIKNLPDDNKGRRHQKFILQLKNGHTLLIAHNIDLAPKIKKLKKNDLIEFYGEYEWTKRGGVIHWTHHDPAGRHQGGWLKHKGKTYE